MADGPSYRFPAASRRRQGRTISLALSVVTAASLVLGGCSSDTAVSAAEAKVAAAQQSLDEAKAAADAASAQFCGASADYVTALDRYGDVLNQTTPTVGDVRTAGRDLKDPGQDAASAGQAAVEAHQAEIRAEQDLAAAQADLAAVRAAATGGTARPSTTASPSASGSPSPSGSANPAVDDAVTRVQQAESEFATAQGGISDDTPLRQAAQQFNAAAVALQMAWLRLYSEAGCLTEPEQEKAASAVLDYTKALQQDLSAAGYFTGKVDGVYDPTTVAGVEALQKAHGLPITGTMDKATEAALRSDLAAKGGVAAQAEVASTAAVQQTLKLAGHWDGPVDGQWTPALTDALTAFQAELGVPPTGTVDAATISALEEAIAEAKETPTTSSTPPPTPSSTSPTPSASAPSSSSE